ncbi:hypothetical protein HY625_01235, partial [Candidatus Uhrbacteria bacterium]|nr:hypothetical protein [Candidatus Uhrbacteria bacterium]
MPLLLILLSSIIILGSFFYYVYALTNGVILFMLAIVLVIVIFKTTGNTRLNTTTLGVGSTPSVYPRKRITILTSIFFMFIAAAFYILFQHQTTDALRSPWESIPLSFFLLYGAVVAILLWRSVASPPPTIAEVSMEESASADGGKPRLRSQSENAEGSPVEHADLPRHRSVSPDGEAAERQSPLLLFLLTFLTLSISLFIFPLGSGFDPFIHQATEKIIAATGTITPKPLYYIGQYTLVVFLSKILGISVAWVDKLLVPLLASILLPWSIGSWLNRKFARSALFSSADDSGAVIGNAGAEGLILQADTSERPSVMKPFRDAHFKTAERVAGRKIAERTTLMSFLLLPFLLTSFTTTTPYSLALLFLVVLIFHVTHNPAPKLSRWYGAGTKHVTNLLLVTATLLIHPLVGIPAFIFLIVTTIQKHPVPSFDKLSWYGAGKNKLLRVMCYVLCALAIPLVFLISSQLSSQIHITFAPNNFLPWLQSLSWHGIYRENRFNAPLDLLYFYG